MSKKSVICSLGKRRELVKSYSCGRSTPYVISPNLTIGFAPCDGPAVSAFAFREKGIVLDRSRKLLLERAGFVVISALGFAEATKACERGEDIDLVVIGHSIPYSDKKKFVSHLRKSCSAPILSLLRHSETPLEGVDFHVSSQSGPTVFLAAIQRAMQSKGDSAEP